MKGHLIVLEGIDGSGKATQSEFLEQNLISLGKDVMHISFPDYESESSALVKMYLRGDFGKDPMDVNPYAASLFYAVDRFASFRTKWKKFYENGGIVIADRYTTSNMVHQMIRQKKGGSSFNGLRRPSMENLNCQGLIWSFCLISLWPFQKG